MAEERAASEVPRPPGALVVPGEFHEIVGYKKDSRWFVRGSYFYVASRTRGHSTTMRCCDEGCPVHWIMRAGQAGPLIGGLHYHYETPWVPHRNAMFRELKRRASVEHIALNTIYEEVAGRYPDAAGHLLYERVLPSMRKWRRSAQPAVPRTLRDYAVALTDHHELGDLLLATVSAAGADAVILVMPGWERCINESDVLVIDGTFLTVPAGLPMAQILTVHSIIEGHNFHPVVVLMENRRRPLYEAIFHRLWQLAGFPRPAHIVTDFEQALRAALMAVTGMQIQGCFFHFVQALVRRAQQIGMAGVQHRNSPTWRLVQLYSTLALLPAQQVQVGLLEVQHIATTERLPFNQDFHDYFIAQWMTRVGPEGFSVHGSVHRTSYVAESFHASLRRSLGPAPNVWRFTEVMRNKFVVSSSRLDAQRQGDAPQGNIDRSLIRTAVQRSNTRALEAGRISIREFLAQTSRAVNVGIDVVLNDVPEVAEEVIVGHDDVIGHENVVRPPTPSVARPLEVAEEVVIDHVDDDDFQLPDMEVLGDLTAYNIRPASPPIRPAFPDLPRFQSTATTTSSYWNQKWTLKFLPSI